MKTKSFRVINNRIQFRCSTCNAKRSMAIQRGVRKRGIRCLKCGTVTQSILNRRTKPREMQTGRCVMITNQGKEIDIDLHDVSLDGLGFDLPMCAARALSISQEVRFKCNWNPRLLGGTRYIVRSITGRRIGAEKLNKRWS